MQKQRRRGMIEGLENRRLMSVSMSSAGWTVVVPDSNAHLIYVSSSSGKDSNSGSSSSPVASLTKAYSLVRNDSDDEILLKRGDTWGSSFGQWTKTGISSQLPILIGTYGSGNRPVVDCGTGNGFICNTAHPVNYLIIQGIVFTDNSRDPTKTSVSSSAAGDQSIGLQILGPSTGVTIEDCQITYFDVNVDLQSGTGAVSNITFRRSTIANAYCTSTHAQGLFADTMSGLILDQDVFDNNGWNASVSGAGIVVYNHDIYSQSTVTGLVVTNCIISNASFAGIMARSGGIIDNNIFENDAVGVSFGNANGATSTPGGVTGNIENNIFMGNHAVSGTAIGEGIELGNIKANSGVTVSGNIFADDNELAQPAITLTYANATSNPSVCVGINDLTISNNIVYGWRTGLLIGPLNDGVQGLTGLNDLTVTGNQLQASPAFLADHQNPFSSSAEHWSNNTYYESNPGNWFELNGIQMKTWTTVDPTGKYTKLSYADPSRTVASYSASIGGSNSQSAFIARAEQQDMPNFSTAYTTAAALAYLKTGFSTGTVSNPLIQFTGTPIGTSGSYQNDGNTIAKAVDGNLSTFFDAPSANGDWVGLDLGVGRVIKQISYAPRVNWANRMIGGVFQASNSATFSIGVVNLFTVTSTPAQNVLTNVTLSNTAGYRYVRYLAPANSFGDIAEMQVFGLTGTVVTGPIQLSGTTIGTGGSYQNDGSTIAKATDGNLSTFFDGPTASGDWVGLDLGSAKVIQQIAFAPRTSWASRMVGGIIQASNTADFSSGVVNLYTITTAPTQGVLTKVTLNVSTAYRYVRYLAPANSFGNIAEFQVFG